MLLSQKQEMEANPDTMAISGDFQLISSSISESHSSVLGIAPHSHKIFFHGLRDTYGFDESVTCNFSYHEDELKEGDIIALLNKEATSLSDAYTTRKVSATDPAITVSKQNDKSMYSITVHAEELPKESSQFIFCYVRENSIIGFSEPFSFGGTESEFIEMEDPNDPGLVVFKSRVAKLTERIEQQNEEKIKLLQVCKMAEETIEDLQGSLFIKNKILEERNHEYVALLQEVESLKSTAFQNPPKDDSTSNLDDAVGSLNLYSKVTEIGAMLEELKSSVSTKEEMRKFTAITDKLNFEHAITDQASQTVSIDNEEIKIHDNTTEKQCSSGCLQNAIEVPSTLPSSDEANEVVDNNNIYKCVKLAAEKVMMQKTMDEFKEENAALKSRIAVLELELNDIFKSKQPEVYLPRIDVLEKENLSLKLQLRNKTKEVCTLQSYEAQCKMLAQENAALKSHFQLKSASNEDSLKRKVLEEKLTKALNDRDNFRKQLINLIEIHLAQSEESDF